MNERKTINLLLEPARRPSGRTPAWPSMVVSTCIALALMGITWMRLPDSAPRAEAAAPSTPPSTSTQVRLASSDPISASLLRADGWVAWDRVLAALLPAAAEMGELEEVRYEHADQTLHISGTSFDVDRVPQLMLALARVSCLKDPVPVRIQQESAGSASRFALEVRVVPEFQLDAERP